MGLIRLKFTQLDCGVVDLPVVDRTIEILAKPENQRVVLEGLKVAAQGRALTTSASECLWMSTQNRLFDSGLQILDDSSRRLGYRLEVVQRRTWLPRLDWSRVEFVGLGRLAGMRWRTR